MFSFLFKGFSKKRSDRAVILAATVTVFLYLAFVCIAEPLRSLAKVTFGMVG